MFRRQPKERPGMKLSATQREVLQLMAGGAEICNYVRGHTGYVVVDNGSVLARLREPTFLTLYKNDLIEDVDPVLGSGYWRISDAGRAALVPTGPDAEAPTG